MTLHDADRDPSVDPGTDFYRWANGGWIDATVIPPGYGAWGSFEEVSKRNETVLHDLLLHAAESPSNDLDRMLGDYFTAGMDVDAVEAAGLTAIAPLLDGIAGVSSYADVLALLPALHSTGITAFFGFGVTVDHDDSTQHLLWLVQSGLGLPDRDSYDSDTEANVALRTAYVDHVAAQLVNTGVQAQEAADLATSVLALETALAAHQMRAEDRRDPRNTLNRHDLAAVHALAPGRPAGLPRRDRCDRRRDSERPDTGVSRGAARRHRGRGRPHAARLPHVPRREDGRRSPSRRRVGRELRVLRQAHRWPTGAEGALPARRGGARPGHGRGARAPVRR